MESGDRFNEALSAIAKKVFQAVLLSEADRLGWKQAYCDVRYSANGTQIKKFRVELQNGEQISLDDPSGSDELFDHVWSLRNEGLIRNWFGIRMTITPAGDCSTDFNFDPKCVGDPSFFQD